MNVNVIKLISLVSSLGVAAFVGVNGQPEVALGLVTAAFSSLPRGS